MNKLINTTTFQIQTNLQTLAREKITYNSKQYFSYIYFVDNLLEKDLIQDKINQIKKNNRFRVRYKKLNKSLKNSNGTRNRLGVFYIELENYKFLKSIIKLINK